MKRAFLLLTLFVSVLSISTPSAYSDYQSDRRNPFWRFNDNTDYHGYGQVNWETASSADKETWLRDCIDVDITDLHPRVDVVGPDRWVCLQYAMQTSINFGFVSGPALPDIYKDPAWSTPNKFNVPLYYVETNNGAHAINCIFTGDDPLNFNDWYFFEPDDDSHVQPGDSEMFVGGTVTVKVPTNFYSMGGFGGYTLVSWVLPTVFTSTLTYQDPSLILPTNWTAGNAAWESASNWDNGTPDAYRIVNVNNNGDSQIAGDDMVCKGIKIGALPGQGGTVSIASGSLETEAVYIGCGGTGTFEQTGGSVSIGFDPPGGDEVAGILMLGAEATGVGTYRISGGSMTTDSITVGASGSGRLEIIGTGTTTNPISVTIVDDYNQNSTSTLTLELDGTDTGVAAIVVGDDVTLIAGANLEITLKSGETLASSEYLLMTCGGAWVGSFILDESLDGTWTLEHRDNSGVNELWIVPEPATMILLGLGGLGLLRRKRQR